MTCDVCGTVKSKGPGWWYCDRCRTIRYYP